jgi:hypothetical protein
LSGKKLPNPLLDIPMAYLQKTNTHLENLEVVELADKAVHKKRLAVIKYAKEDDFKSHPIFNFPLFIIVSVHAAEISLFE